MLRGNMATLEKEIAEATKRQAEAENKLAEMRKRQEPRVVQNEETLLSILGSAPPGKIIIGYQQGFSEAGMFASSIAIVLRKAKWNVLEIRAVPSVLCKGGFSVSEMFLCSPDLDHMDISEKALDIALRSVGYSLTTVLDKTLPGNIPTLLIGPKL